VKLADVVDFPGTARFAVMRRIGSGGMGVVYQARDLEQGVVVALKTLKNVDAQSIYRFKAEFRALADLSHDNLVRLGELFCEDGQWFFTMELVQGMSFLGWVDVSAPTPYDGGESSPTAETRRIFAGGRPVHSELRGSNFDEPRLRSSLGQLAQGLSALHAAGKVHRDVKPSNVLVTPEGRVVLLDFGLVAEALSDAESNDVHVSEAHVVGTVAYMAPEQATGRPVGPEADWYGMGVMLYEALTGKLPFTGAPLEVLMNKQRFDPPAPRTIAPSVPADLEALCVDLLRFDPGSRPPGREILERLGVGTAAEPAPLRITVSSGGGNVFVGRRHELAALREAYDDSRSGRGVTLFVEGESGIGKSAVVRRFLDEVSKREPDAVILSGRCYERESVPYKAFDDVVDAISRHLNRLDQIDVALLLPHDAAILARIFPVLRRVPAVARTRAKQEVVSSHELRIRAFGALRQLLLALCEKHPVIVFIDDFQWADADSIALFTEVLQADPPPLLFVATLRTSSDPALPERPSRAPAPALPRPSLLPPSSSLRGSGAVSKKTIPPIQTMGPTPDARYLRVDPLSPEETRQLVADLTSAWPGGPAASAESIARETGGHPLFIHELVRYRSARTGAGGSSALRLDAALWSRIQELDPPARRLLEIFAVAGAPLSIDIAAGAADLGPADRDRWLSLLRVAHLVRTNVARGADAVEPYHDRVREAVLAHLDAETRRRDHARLADALEALGDDADPRIVVRHLLAAGETQRAARQAERAAQLAGDAFAFDQAAEFYRAALELSDQDEADARALRMRLADVLRDGGRGVEAAEAYVAAARGADAATRLECRREAAHQLLVSGHIERGLESLAAVLGEIGATLPATPRRALASLLWQRAKLRLRGLGWTPKDPTEIPAAELVRADVYQTVGMALGLVDNIRGADFQARGLLLVLRTGERIRIARALALEGIFQAAQGRSGLPRARRLLGEARRIAEESRDPYLLVVVPGMEGFLHYFCGEFRACVERLWAAEASYIEHPFVGPRFELQTGRIFRLLALRHLGKLRELEGWLDEYVRDAVRRGDRYTETSLVRVGNPVWLARDEPAAARRSLERRLWIPPEGTFHVQHWYEVQARIEIDLYEGRAATTREALRPQFDELERSLLLRVVPIRTICRWLEGRVALAEAVAAADPRAALARARRAERQLVREGLASTIVWAKLLRAGIAARAGDTVAAKATLEDAIAGAESLGMALYVAAARRKLGEIEGGDEGAANIAAADAWMAAEGIINPARMAGLYVPGFELGAARALGP